jgi:Na+-driven multidrug efflux pump
MFSSMPSMVIGQAMQPILGFNFGARRYRLALKVISLSALATLVFGVSAFIILYTIPKPIIGIFTNDNELIAVTITAVRFIFVALPLLSLFSVGQLIFPSIGKVAQSFIIAISRPALFLAPLTLILPHLWQMHGVWLAFPGSDTLGFLLVLGLFIPLIFKWRKAPIVNKEIPSPALDASSVGH